MPEEKAPHGTFCWNELVTRDTAAAKRFYTELLGWKAVEADMPGMKYTVFKAGERDAGGMMDMPPEMPAGVPAHWMAYVAVDDVDAAARRARELGGTLLHGPQDVPGVGRFCVVQDPAGGVISLMRMG